jgi:hypothetical protein
VADSYEYGNEPLGSIQGKEFLDYLSNYYILKDFSMELVSWNKVQTGRFKMIQILILQYK